MKVALRILAVNVIAGLAGAMAFSVHVWILFGFDIPGDFIAVCFVGILASLLASVVLVPLFFSVQKFAPASIHVGLIVGISIVASVLYATFALTQWKRLAFDLPDLIGRAWNVYMYFAVFAITYAISWVLLVVRFRASRATPVVASA